MHKELNIIYLDVIDSTNRYALRNFAELPDAALVVANGQNAGRGRHARQWLSPPNTNIYASLVVKNAGRNPVMASIIASLGALSTLRETAPEIKFWLKWPNDIFCRERKIAGILCETASDAEDRFAGVVAGIGINVNMPPEIICRIDQPASSLRYETGSKFNLKKIAEKLAKNLNKYYSIYSILPEALFDLWKTENLLLGRDVGIDTGTETISGRIIDLGRSGEIIFETAGGQTRFFSGDVRINKDSIDFEKLVPV
ncbi:MAG: biotin--[acetyl-CoA-carboxylase] ligase [Victivallaceae bacterium]|nr:biotin--[acetyl-CoA-carboxylase] ligase [Victivallaceae bacterium]